MDLFCDKKNLTSVDCFDKMFIKLVLRSIADNCVFREEWKTLWDKKKMLFPIFSTFPHSFQKAPLFRVIKTWDCEVNIVTVKTHLTSLNLHLQAGVPYQKHRSQIFLSCCPQSLDPVPDPSPW